LEEILGILECRLKIVKLGFQFYIFGEGRAVGEERKSRWGGNNIFWKSINWVLENFGHYRPN